MPPVTKPGSTSADAVDKLTVELLGPASHHLMTDFDPTGRRHPLDQVEAYGLPSPAGQARFTIGPASEVLLSTQERERIQ